MWFLEPIIMTMIIIIIVRAEYLVEDPSEWEFYQNSSSFVGSWRLPELYPEEEEATSQYREQRSFNEGSSVKDDKERPKPRRSRRTEKRIQGQWRWGWWKESQSSTTHRWICVLSWWRICQRCWWWLNHSWSKAEKEKQEEHANWCQRATINDELRCFCGWFAIIATGSANHRDAKWPWIEIRRLFRIVVEQPSPFFLCRCFVR